jgi:hypothetical protein
LHTGRKFAQSGPPGFQIQASEICKQVRKKSTSSWKNSALTSLSDESAIYYPLHPDENLLKCM